MKDLTTKQAEWLALVLEQGYDHPTFAMPNKPLRALVRLGLLERHPNGFVWRPSQKAVDEYEVL